MANGTSAGSGLGTTPTISTGKKSTSRTGSTGKKSTGPGGGAGGRPGTGRPAGGAAGRPISGGVGGGRPDLVRMGQLLSGGGTPGAGVGAGVPAGMPGMFKAGIPSGGMPISVGGLPTAPGDSSQYDFGMQNMGDLATLNLGQEMKTPTSYVTGRGGPQVGSVSKQDVSDFFNNLTMSKLENLSPEGKTAFDKRMVEATKRKESLKWPQGIDPELMEQRITAAESEKLPNSSNVFKELRSLQTEPTTFQNVGSMLKTGAKGVGSYLENLGQHMGVYQKPLWPAEGAKQRSGWVKQRIIHGEGTPTDWRKASDFISKRRAENYAAGITVPEKNEFYADYMRGGEDRTQGIPYGIKFANAPDLSLPPKPSTYEAPRKTSVLQPQAQPQQSRSTGYSSYGGGSYGGLSPEERQYLENAPASFGKEPTLVAGNEKKETFNLLEMLMGLLGLGGGKSMGKSPPKNLNREPGLGEIDTRPAQLGVEPGIG